MPSCGIARFILVLVPQGSGTESNNLLYYTALQNGANCVEQYRS